MSVARCFCCNSELTAPTIIEGKLYGYTCAAKIQGGKDARKFKLIPAKLIKQIKTPCGFVYAAIIEYDGVKDKSYYDSITGKLSRTETIDDQLFIRVKR